MIHVLHTANFKAFLFCSHALLTALTVANIVKVPKNVMVIIAFITAFSILECIFETGWFVNLHRTVALWPYSYCSV